MSEMNVEENLQYTPERAEQLLQNYRRVLERIRTAEQDHSAVRTEASAPVQLVTVTKFFPASDAAALLDGGVSLFGENRDQEASAKARELAAYCAQREVQPPHWAFIGQLQTNKAKSVVKYASSVHSVDRPSLADALAKASSFHPDIVILDVQMPRMDGLETLARLRARDPELPVLFLTARDAVADRVQGLRAGADDYVTKPFDLDEVAARVEALLRRAGRTQQTVSAVLQVADLTLDVDSHDVRRGGEEITLTNTEFELLRYLMENVGIVLSKQKILDAVWSYDFGGQMNVVELYISYLRKKIDADRPALIRTVRGAGYILREPQ